MKKIVTLLMVAAAMCCGSAVANAQAGLEVGYANSAQRLKGNDGEVVKTPQSGFYIELDYGVRLFKGLKIAPGIQYMYLAGESKFPVNLPAPQQENAMTLGDVTSTELDGPNPDKRPETVEHYLSIPVDISYTFDFGRFFGLTAFVTPTMNCGLKSDMKIGNTSTDMYKVMEEMLGKKNAYSRVDFQLGVGLAADFARHFRVKFSYDFGLVDRANVSEFALRHNMFKVGLGVMF